MVVVTLKNMEVSIMNTIITRFKNKISLCIHRYSNACIQYENQFYRFREEVLKEDTINLQVTMLNRVKRDIMKRDIIIAIIR